MAHPEDLEVPDCPMCGATERRLVHRLGSFGISRCGACGFRYLSPRLPEAAMLDLYRSGQYFEGGDVGYVSYGDQTRALRATFRRVVADLVAGGFAGGDLLEVGSGYGYLLDAARGAFRTVIGTEFADDAAAATRARGLDVVTGGLDDLPPDRTFDCIVATHVIEHVYDPHGFAAALWRRSRPGGVVVLGTPDIGSLWYRLLGARWPSFKVPEHVLYFDRPSLTNLLTGAGFERVEPFPYLHAFPVSLIASKLGAARLVRPFGGLGEVPIRVPATTLALSARRPADPI